MIDIEEIAARLAAIPTDGVFTANAPSDIANLLDEVERLRAAETRVRELHRQGDWIPGTPISGCTGCDDLWESEPCRTIRALEANDD